MTAALESYATSPTLWKLVRVRLNVPSVFIYGGSILPGRFNGKDVTVVDVFEGVGKYSSGKMSAHALRKLELKSDISNMKHIHYDNSEDNLNSIIKVVYSHTQTRCGSKSM